MVELIVPEGAVPGQHIEFIYTPFLIHSAPAAACCWMIHGSLEIPFYARLHSLHYS